MPTASERLRKFAEAHFGGISDTPIIDALERRGFTHTPDFCWRRGRAPDHFEWDCINFLIQEWDWGGYDED